MVNSGTGEEPRPRQQHAQLGRQRSSGCLGRRRLRVADEVPPRGNARQLATERLAQPAFDPVAHNRSPDPLASDDAHPRRPYRIRLTGARERSELPTDAPSSPTRAAEVARRAQALPASQALVRTYTLGTALVFHRLAPRGSRVPAAIVELYYTTRATTGRAGRVS